MVERIGCERWPRGAWSRDPSYVPQDMETGGGPFASSGQTHQQTVCHPVLDDWGSTASVGDEWLCRRDLLTSCSRRNDTGWHWTTPDDTRRHVEPRSVPGRSNFRIRCPKGRGSSTLPSRTPSDLRILAPGLGSDGGRDRRLAHTCSQRATRGYGPMRPFSD
jgi:hypothetical protein